MHLDSVEPLITHTMVPDYSEFINDNEPEPIMCPDCGGTGCHPYLQASCRRCHGSGEIGDDCYDERYKIHVYRATRGCFEHSI